MKLALVFTSAAQADLEEIFWFIAADNPRRARHYIAEIEDACRKLSEMPQMGAEGPDLRSDLRILPFRRRIVIADEVSRERVDGLRIFSGGRDYEAIMAGDV